MMEMIAVREEAKRLDAMEINGILPHRYPFALVDRVLDHEPGQWAVGRKCVTMNEQFFQGHFPGQPVMPGVLIIEALAQTGAIAALTEADHRGKLVLFGGIRNARFRRQVLPGDVLRLECRMMARKGSLGVGQAAAWVDGQLACQAELSFVITDRRA